MKIELLFSVLQNISVVIASVVAIYGINSWRREAKWKRKYELAEEVLSLFYGCKEVMAIIRSPLSYSSEGKTRKRGENESIEESSRLDSAYVFIERYEREKEPFIKLRTLKFRFMIVFGKDVEQSFDELNGILNTIFSSARILATVYWRNQGLKDFSEVEFQKHLKEMHEHEENIWAGYGDNDTILNRVENCIIKIENSCKSIIFK